MKKTKIIATSLALIGVLAIGGISAYFTDTEHAPNTFTIGDGVDIKLDEPSWNPDDPTHDDITPNSVFAKDPFVKNEGDISAFTFLTVSIPYENIATTNDNGTVNEAVDTELFSYETNNGWTQIGDGVKNSTAKTVTYTYVYGSETECTELSGGQSTSKLFDEIKFADISEGKINGQTLTVDVNAYAIQTNDINGGTKVPADVWSVLSNSVVNS